MLLGVLCSLNLPSLQVWGYFFCYFCYLQVLRIPGDTISFLMHGSSGVSDRIHLQLLHDPRFYPNHRWTVKKITNLAFSPWQLFERSQNHQRKVKDLDTYLLRMYAIKETRGFDWIDTLNTWSMILGSLAKKLLNMCKYTLHLLQYQIPTFFIFI